MKNEILTIQNKITQKQAIQWTGDNEPFIRQFIADDNKVHMLGSNIEIWNEEEKFWMPVQINHYIIRGIKGEFYSISPEVFDRSYEIVK